MTALHRARYAAYLALGTAQTAETHARRDGGPAEQIAAIRDTLRGVVVELESLTSGGLAFSQPTHLSVRRQTERRVG